LSLCKGSQLAYYQELDPVKTLDIARTIFSRIEPLDMAALGMVNEKLLHQQASNVYISFTSEQVEKLSVTQQKKYGNISLKKV
jgi:hypothetical protein